MWNQQTNERMDGWMYVFFIVVISVAHSIRTCITSVPYVRLYNDHLRKRWCACTFCSFTFIQLYLALPVNLTCGSSDFTFRFLNGFFTRIGQTLQTFWPVKLIFLFWLNETFFWTNFMYKWNVCLNQNSTIKFKLHHCKSSLWKMTYLLSECLHKNMKFNNIVNKWVKD